MIAMMQVNTCPARETPAQPPQPQHNNQPQLLLKIPLKLNPSSLLPNQKKKKSMYHTRQRKNTYLQWLTMNTKRNIYHNLIIKPMDRRTRVTIISLTMVVMKRKSRSPLLFQKLLRRRKHHRCLVNRNKLILHLHQCQWFLHLNRWVQIPRNNSF